MYLLKNELEVATWAASNFKKTRDLKGAETFIRITQILSFARLVTTKSQKKCFYQTALHSLNIQIFQIKIDSWSEFSILIRRYLLNPKYAVNFVKIVKNTHFCLDKYDLKWNSFSQLYTFFEKSVFFKVNLEANLNYSAYKTIKTRKVL